MKCQKCAKPATFHITDIVEKGKHREFHFCDEHARQHLAPPDETSEPPISELAKKLIIGRAGRARRPGPARAVAGRQAGLSDLPDHLPRIPELGPSGLSL